MRPQRTKNVLVLTTAAAAAALLLSGCAAGTERTQSTGAAAGPTASTASAPASTDPSGSDGPTPASPQASPAASSQPAAPSVTALCKAAGLAASIEVTGAATGSVYQEVVLTNSGTGPCLLQGFPGVSLTADANGEPIGAPAVREASSPVTGTVLAPGQAGSATLRYTQAGNYPDCELLEAAGFRIYPPEDTASLFVPDPRNACSNTEIKLLTIGAFKAR